MNWYVIGAMSNSALYLAVVFIAGFTIGKDVAWKLDIAAIGVTYLSYIAGMAIGNTNHPETMTKIANSVVWLSIALGAAAGFALLF